MTGTDDDPRVPNPYHVRRGVGEPTGATSTWAPTGTRMEPGPGGAWENWGIFAGVVLLIAGFGHVLCARVGIEVVRIDLERHQPECLERSRLHLKVGEALEPVRV